MISIDSSTIDFALIKESRIVVQAYSICMKSSDEGIESIIILENINRKKFQVSLYDTLCFISSGWMMSISFY